MNNTFPPQDVDFLPNEYRHQHARRRRLSQEILGGVALVAVLVVAAGSQAYWGQHVRRQLAEVVPQYDRAVAQTEELNKLQAELQVAQAEAQLITYLRHPWPCTQLLSALVSPLPEAVAFREIRISREAGKIDIMAAPPVDRQTLEQQLAKLPRAGRDLKALRDQFDRSATVMSLAGVASDSRAVYQYLGELGKNRLLAKVDLVSLDNASNRPEDKLEFKLSVTARPGYGQPEGPTGPAPGMATGEPRAKGGRP